MKAWFEHNLHSLGLALQTLRAMPFASLFSILVIGIALALPAGLYLALANLDRMAGGAQARAEITLYLDTKLDEDQGRQLARKLAQRPDVARTRFVAKADGLKRLSDAGLTDLTAGLTENPLPDAIMVAPAETDPNLVERLAAECKGLPGVDSLVLDSDWAKRLAALIGFGHDLVIFLAALLGLALAAITGNTIRLQIYAAREEIEVSRLIGATDRFIRRPFLYFGALQGLLGGLAGWAIVSAGLLVLDGPLTRLAAALGSQLSLSGLSLVDSVALLAGAALLGFLGAFLAVNRSLSKLE
ncbi:MAG: ABC transporter permease [Thiobacillus sp.]|nr:ABC transporter permease [Thiobacillus sp.]